MDVTIDDATATDRLRRQAVPGYFCPSRRRSSFNTNSYGLNDYAAATPGQIRRNANGSFLDYTTDDAGRLWAGDNPPSGEIIWQVQNNLVFYGVIVRTPFRSFDGYGLTVGPTNGTPPTDYGSILDGTANTVVVGEKFVPSYATLGGYWADDCGWADGWDPDVIRTVSYRPRPDEDPSENGEAFGSAHPGGVNFAFADGSVRVLRFNINRLVFASLGHRADLLPYHQESSILP
jgi:prepilin-type processing-associated H-X9-DG protein